MRKGIPALLAAAFLALALPYAEAAVRDGASSTNVPTTVADTARFPHRLVASHQPAESDLARLRSLLAEYTSSPEPGNFAAIERYLQSESDSPWRLALRLNLGTLYYESGYYSRAIEAFDAAWHEEGSDPNAQLVPLRDSAIGELARMHARLGHVEDLETLLAEIGDRPLYGLRARPSQVPGKACGTCETITRSHIAVVQRR